MQPDDHLRLTRLESQVAYLLQRRKAIQAIKMYRELTGASLKDAKTAVEGMARDMGVRL